ncbi:MAG: hypothetical protein JNM96_07975, partial [Bacteroidia bacterium]|nr:hypothetical protein [Bacteroidia bacterium]
TVIPEENIPFDGTVYTLCAAYYQVGDKESGNKIAKKLFDIFEGDLMIYNSLKEKKRAAFSREIDQAKEIMKRLIGLTQQFKQEELSKEFISRISKIVPAQEMMPDEDTQVLPTEMQ